MCTFLLALHKTFVRVLVYLFVLVRNSNTPIVFLFSLVCSLVSLAHIDLVTWKILVVELVVVVYRFVVERIATPVAMKKIFVAEQLLVVDIVMVATHMGSNIEVVVVVASVCKIVALVSSTCIVVVDCTDNTVAAVVDNCTACIAVEVA